jgi:N-acetylglucosamine-6-phosphate deacetylase
MPANFVGPTFLTGASVLVNGRFRPGQGVLITHTRIAAVLPADSKPAATRVALPAGSLLAPGLIDIQVNGGGGLLFNNAPNQATARAIAAAHRSLGTTSILPTLITDDPGRMREAAGVVAEPGYGVLGLHFEGPFLGAAKPGVHPPEHIRAPDEDDLVLLEQLGRRASGRLLLTVAPETVDDATLRRLAEAGVILSAGHSAATFERTGQAIQAGITGFTHLFNAMPPVSAREPGIALAALLDRGAYCGVIADGIHVHPALLRLLFAAKPDRTILVSDAMPPTGTDLQSFVLQGRLIHRARGSLRTADNVLAGADICLADAVRFCVRELGLPPEQAIGMATAAPADFLRVRQKIGRIAAGLRADLVLLGPDLDVLGTWLGGDFQGDPAVARAA